LFVSVCECPPPAREPYSSTPKNTSTKNNLRGTYKEHKHGEQLKRNTRQALCITVVVSHPRALQAGTKKHSGFKCLQHLPDAGRSEYFLVDAPPLVTAAASLAGAAGAGSSAAGAAGATAAAAAAGHGRRASVGRVVVSRVWKTGTVALGSVFKCLFGRQCLHYSALEKHRGPFVEPAAPLRERRRGHATARRALRAVDRSRVAAPNQLPLPFVHAVMVREPVGRFVSGYLEASRLAFVCLDCLSVFPRFSTWVCMLTWPCRWWLWWLLLVDAPPPKKK
jgi:hypothetical protein